MGPVKVRAIDKQLQTMTKPLNQCVDTPQFTVNKFAGQCRPVIAPESWYL